MSDAFYDLLRVRTPATRLHSRRMCVARRHFEMIEARLQMARA